MTRYKSTRDINVMSTGLIRKKGSFIGEGEIPPGIREAMIGEGVLIPLDKEGAPLVSAEGEIAGPPTPGIPEGEVVSYEGMSKAELKELCKERGLPVGGRVSTLIERLEEFDAEQLMEEEEAPEKEAGEGGDE